MRMVRSATATTASTRYGKRAVTVAVTALPSAIADQNNPESSAKEKEQRLNNAVDATLCHK